MTESESESERAREFINELRELATLVERTGVGVVNYYIGAKTRLSDGSLSIVNVASLKERT